MFGVWFLLAALACPLQAHAQETGAPAASPPGVQAAPASRVEALEAQRAERALALQPAERSRLERLLIYVEDHRLIERLNPPEGLYPRAGGIVRGSAMGLGLGYRKRPAGGRALLDTSAAWTYRGYRTVEFGAGLPALGSRRIGVMTGVRWFDYPQEDYYGLGPDTRRADRVSFTLRGLDTFTRVQARPVPWFVIGGRAGVQRYELAPGKARRSRRSTRCSPTRPPRPSPGRRHCATPKPRPASTPATSRATRAPVGSHHRGRRLPRRRRQPRLQPDRREAHAVFPIFDKKRAIALHALASRRSVGPARVPFFLMPTVRAAPTRCAAIATSGSATRRPVNLNANAAGRPSRGLDLALFVDAGDVGPTWRSIVGAHLRSSWGIGIPLQHQFPRVPARRRRWRARRTPGVDLAQPGVPPMRPGVRWTAAVVVVAALAGAARSRSRRTFRTIRFASIRRRATPGRSASATSTTPTTSSRTRS
ncbi:MAG: hypothetical protein R2708_05540 [Vicinamibacterales bacterium]